MARISSKIEIGDTVEITVSARRGGKAKVRRKVTALGRYGVGVRFDGYNPYWVGYAVGDRVKLVEKAKPTKTRAERYTDREVARPRRNLAGIVRETRRK